MPLYNFSALHALSRTQNETLASNIMYLSEEKLPFLPVEENVDESHLRCPARNRDSQFFTNYKMCTGITLFLIASLLCNILLSYKLRLEKVRPDLCRSNYSKWNNHSEG